MFTGIVEQVGTVVSVSPTDTGLRVVFDAPGIDDVDLGASISVNGVCLTAVAIEESSLSVDVVPETLARTSLDGIEPGSRVNLERAMSASGRFDGHVVQGHVDGTGTVLQISEDASGGVVMRISVPATLSRFIVEKGSITVDGVSLTVAALSDEWLEVALIPHTLAVTTLGLRTAGDRVNLEVDVLAKYVERILNAGK